MPSKRIQLGFESRRFSMRLYTRADYAAWRSAHEAMFEKQNDFDQDKKSARELTPKEYRKILAQHAKYRRQGALYQFGIFEKKTGRLMGFILLALVLRFNVQSCRISYSIFNNYWKRGYGKEAVDAAAQFAFKRLKLHRLEAEILPGNRASIALVRGLGFQYEGIRRGAVYFSRKWHDHAIYSLLAEDRGVRMPRPTIFT